MAARFGAQLNDRGRKTDLWVFGGCLLSILSTYCQRKLKLITFSNLGGYLCVAGLFHKVEKCMLKIEQS